MCLLVTKFVACEYDPDIQKYDIFEAAHLNGLAFIDDYNLINKFLIDNTGSVEPNDNFDILLDRFIIDLKSRKPRISARMQATRLFLALSTINEESQCSSYSVNILFQNNNALENRLLDIKPNAVFKRTEKIVAFHILKHAIACQPLYMGRFNGLIGNLDRDSVRNVERFFSKAIQRYTSEPQGGLSAEITRTYVERLFNIIDDKIFTPYAINPEYIYDELKDVAKDDPQAEYLEPVENEREGKRLLDSEKFRELYREYISYPCRYYIDQLGPRIFNLISFDSKFYHEVQDYAVDFYEAWVRFKFCSTRGLSDTLLTETIMVVSHEERSTGGKF